MRDQGLVVHDALIAFGIVGILAAIAIPKGLMLRSHHPLAGNVVAAVGGLLAAYGLYIFPSECYYRDGWRGVAIGTIGSLVALTLIGAGVLGVGFVLTR